MPWRRHEASRKTWQPEAGARQAGNPAIGRENFLILFVDRAVGLIEGPDQAQAGAESQLFAQQRAILVGRAVVGVQIAGQKKPQTLAQGVLDNKTQFAAQVPPCPS